MPGPEANLNYHTLNRDFARNLCKAHQRRPYCTAADHFTRYLKEDPTLEPQRRAFPLRRRAGKGVRFRFKLSKIGARGHRRALGAGAPTSSTSARSRTASATSAGCRRGEAASAPTTYTLFARDLAGNTSTATGDVRVKAPPSGSHGTRLRSA